MRGSVALLLVVVLGVPAALAQNSVFPPAPPDSATAAGKFSDRSRAIVAFNACGRELDYSGLRKELKHGSYENQGEGFTGILIAKIAWLTDSRFSHLPCVHETIIPRPKQPDGNWVYSRLAGPGFDHLDGELPITYRMRGSRARRGDSDA